MKLPGFNKRWLIPAIAACAVSSCSLVDQQYAAARYGDFGNAVATECRFATDGVVQDGSSKCPEMASCVRFHLAQQDATGPREFLRIRDAFKEQMREFVDNQPSAFTVSGEPIKPEGELQDWQGAFEFRLGPDGEILRWSAGVRDWMSDERNIRDESLPLRVDRLMAVARQRDDTAAVRLYQLFLDARRACGSIPAAP